MNVEAYICDFCNNLRLAEEVVGISPVEDMFEKMKSFPIVNNPAKAHIHFCTSCFDTYAVQVAYREVDRRKSEHLYKLKLDEMTYLLRSQCVTNYNKKNQKKRR